MNLISNYVWLFCYEGDDGFRMSKIAEMGEEGVARKAEEHQIIFSGVMECLRTPFYCSKADATFCLKAQGCAIVTYL
jgi:hypothetical protein